VQPFQVPVEELVFRASRASGPGGQHVNKTSSRIEVLWDVARSRALDPPRRARLLERLGSRLDADGVVRVVAGERRSQRQNRLAAAVRLQALVDAALHDPPPRKRTRPPKRARERRLEQKRRRSGTKVLRGRVREND
jgi:ribosome-associated protein